MVSYHRRPERLRKARRFSMIGRVRRKATCTYCGRIMEPPRSKSSLAYTRDHVIPKSLGGTKTVPCCRRCNELKGNMMPEEWAAYMRANPKWWKKGD